ncbi:MAG TPA: HAD hydrolase family protein [Candidatus Dormibacteraeota bacterium]|nr:HAD hydrolase family protein [Candidatus Dormibacteraeota bacterium]
MPTIDLIALDLDGTLLQPDDSVAAEERAAITEALAGGIRVVLVTGRGAEFPAMLAAELGLDLPVICCHGALTKDFLSGRTLGHIPLPLAQARDLIAFGEQHDLDLAVYHEERFHRLAGRQRYMADMVAPSWVELESFSELREGAPTMLRFLGAQAVERVRDELVGRPVHAKFERWGSFEECAITALEATKLHALAALCRDLRVSAEHVLAIGDSANDLPMLQWAGVGVAMGNADLDVRGAVAFQTDDVRAHGAAMAIERFALAPLRRRSA